MWWLATESKATTAMYQPNFDSIARKIVHDCLAVMPGEQGIMSLRSDAVSYGELIAAQANRIGSPVTIYLTGDEWYYSQQMDTPLDYLPLPNEPMSAAIRASDYMISVGMSRAEPERFHDLPSDRTRLLGERNRARSTSIYSDGGPRWVGTDYPTRYAAQAFRLPWTRIYESFWQAMDTDYGQLRDIAAAVGEQMEEGQHFSLRSSRGKELHFTRGSRLIFRDDGRAPDIGNLPAGEVAFAPIETSVEGDVICDVAFVEGMRLANLHLRFENGNMTPMGADYGFDEFMRFWERHDGDRNRLGEVGIGINPAVTTAIGFELLDQKSFGIFHVTLGENNLMGAANVTSLRLPLYVTQATLYVDDRLLLNRGRLSERLFR